MTPNKPPLDLRDAWSRRHEWQARRDALPHRVDVSLEVAAAERMVPEYLHAARLVDPGRARACQEVMAALWAWCARPEGSEPFDRDLAEAFWALPEEDEDAWVPELDGFADEAFAVIAAACHAPLGPKFRDTTSGHAYEFVQLRRAEPATRAAFESWGPLGEAVNALYDISHFRMAEIAIQETALRIAEARETALTRRDAWDLEARSGELLATHGSELLDVYREFLQARAGLYADHFNPAARRGAAVLYLECAQRATTTEARQVHLEHALEQAKRVGADDLVAYVTTHT